MSKKVLILSASPRKGGNSDLLCDEFLRGAEECGNSVEKIFIAEREIHYCTGCEVCNKTHRCVQTDDMAGILEKMIAADVIVMATPVYFYTMDAQMKTLIDRTLPRYTEISNKEFYFILSAADSKVAAMERAIESFRGFTVGCLKNPVEKGIVYGVGVWQKGEIRGKQAMQEAYALGKNV